MRASLATLRRNYRAAKAASAKDTPPPPPGAQPPSVAAITKSHYTAFLKSLDADAATAAARNLAGALFVVLATLKLKFARALAVGDALAALACHRASPSVEAAISPSLSADARRLAPLLVRALLHLCGIAAAALFPFTSIAVLTAWAGAKMLLTNGLAAARALSPASAAKTIESIAAQEEVVAAGLAALALVWQMWCGGDYGLILRALALPVAAAEWWLSLALSALA